jgi:Pyruvate kinase, barrel domain
MQPYVFLFYMPYRTKCILLVSVMYPLPAPQLWRTTHETRQSSFWASSSSNWDQMPYSACKIGKAVSFFGHPRLSSGSWSMLGPNAQFCMQNATNCILLGIRRRKLGQRKNMNLQGVLIDLPVLTEKDVADVQQFACKNDMDFISASFIQTADDVRWGVDHARHWGAALGFWAWSRGTHGHVPMCHGTLRPFGFFGFLYCCESGCETSLMRYPG